MTGRAGTRQRSPYPPRVIAVNPAGVRGRRWGLPREACTVSERGLREPQGTLIAVQESAEGIVGVRKYIEGLNGMERRVGACISWVESGRK